MDSGISNDGRSQEFHILGVDREQVDGRTWSRTAASLNRACGDMNQLAGWVRGKDWVNPTQVVRERQDWYDLIQRYEYEVKM